MAEVSDQSSAAEDDAVLEYLAAVETRRATPPDFPEPDRIVGDLASGAMVKPADDPEGLSRELSEYTPGGEANIERLEEGFVAGARSYARRHDLGYQAFIEAGVDPSVLERAGIRPEGD